MKRIDFFPGRDEYRAMMSWFEFKHITGLDDKQANKLYWIDAVDINESPARFVFMINQIPEFVRRFFLQNRLA